MNNIDNMVLDLPPSVVKYTLHVSRTVELCHIL